MKIKPLFDRVLVCPIEKETTTKSGLILSFRDDTEVANLGKVVAVGDGKQSNGNTQNIYLKEGQTVLFEEHMAAKLIVENTTDFLLRQLDILAVVEEE